LSLADKNVGTIKGADKNVGSEYDYATAWKGCVAPTLLSATMQRRQFRRRAFFGSSPEVGGSTPAWCAECG
jgi:hypothetical protein